jgi:hypothetical protein
MPVYKRNSTPQSLKASERPGADPWLRLYQVRNIGLWEHFAAMSEEYRGIMCICYPLCGWLGSVVSCDKKMCIVLDRNIVKIL